MFINFLERGQNLRQELFTIGLFIVDFSLIRNPRLRSITEEENNNVDTVAIELINCWRKREAARGIEAGLFFVAAVHTGIQSC